MNEVYFAGVFTGDKVRSAVALHYWQQDLRQRGLLIVYKGNSYIRKKCPHLYFILLAYTNFSFILEKIDMQGKVTYIIIVPMPLTYYHQLPAWIDHGNEATCHHSTVTCVRLQHLC
jgi:hypothetical protein